MTYTSTKNQPLDSDVVALIEKIRAGDPAAIAPEVYGLRKVVAKEPAVTVLKLMELPNEVLATYDVEEDGKKVDMLPKKDETFGEWKKRTQWSESFDSKAEDAAYTNIGYDWVDWQWLEPGNSPRTKKKATKVRPNYDDIDR